MQRSLILFLPLVMMGCGPNEEEILKETNRKLTESLPGTWQVTYLRVDIDSYQGGGRDSIFEAREESWETQFQVKPFRLFFARDEKFHQTFRGRENTLLGEYFGVWKLRGDTLNMVQSDQDVDYKIEIGKGQLQMIGLMDWDKDGNNDDTYYTRNRLISKRSVE